MKITQHKNKKCNKIEIKNQASTEAFQDSALTSELNRKNDSKGSFNGYVET